MNKSDTLLYCTTFEFVLCYYGFGKQPDSWKIFIKLAKSSSMAVVQKCFFFTLSALGPVNIFLTKKMGDMPRQFNTILWVPKGYIIC